MGVSTLLGWNIGLGCDPEEARACDPSLAPFCSPWESPPPAHYHAAPRTPLRSTFFFHFLLSSARGIPGQRLSAGAVSGSARRRGRPPEGRTWHGANFLHPEPRRPGSIAMELDQTLERVHPSASGDDQRATGWRGTRAVLAWSPAMPPPPSLPRPPPGTTRMPVPEAIERSPRPLDTRHSHPRQRGIHAAPQSHLQALGG